MAGNNASDALTRAKTMKKFPLFIFILCAACSMWTCTEREDPLKNIGIDRESIVNIEEMTLYVASVKMYPYTDREISEDDLYNKYTEGCFIVKYAQHLDWEFGKFTVYDFPYEKGYEYKLRGLMVDFLPFEARPACAFVCQEILSKEPADSQMLPEPQPLPDPILLDSVERILYVASDKRQHPDMPEGENLYESAWGFQVRETPNTEWQLYDRPIYDFDYEKEYEYTIEVAEEIWEDFYGRMFNAAHWKATLSKQEKDSFAKP